MLNQLISNFGFNYDNRQGIFYSKIDAWQRNVGYFTLYDYAAPLALMNIHCEPIRFDYAGKKWKIELWKGQYGVCTGAEIGVYTGRFPLNIPTVDHHLTQLIDGDTQVAAERDWLKMGIILKKVNGQEIFRRTSDDPNTSEVEKKHWWVTGFKPGITSLPSELICEIQIIFKDVEMLDAFEIGLKKVGYKKDEYTRFDDLFGIKVIFATPYTEQPNLGRAIGLSVEEIVSYMISVYDDIANTYTITQVYDFLRGHYILSWNDIVQILYSLNFIIEDIYNFILGLLNMADREIAKLLAIAGFTAAQIGYFFKNTLNYTANLLAEFLHYAGFSIEKTGDFINSAYEYTKERIASTLKYAGYGISEIGIYLARGLSSGAETVARILRSLGYSINEVGNFLKNDLNKTANEIVLILNSAGYTLSQIVNYIKTFFNKTLEQAFMLVTQVLNQIF